MTQFSTGRRFAFGLLAAATVLGTGGAAMAETVTLRFSRWLPPKHEIMTEMIEPWAKQVAEVTEGRVKVQFINALGKPQAHYDLVATGAADLAMSVHSYNPSRFVLTQMGELPLYSEKGEDTSVALWRTYAKFFQSANEHEGVKLLGMWATPASYIFTTKDQLAGMDALKGLKLRSPSPMFDETAKLIGAVPVNAPASEGYEMLSRGIIDGMFFQHDQIAAFKLDKLMKSAVVNSGGFGHTTQYMIMNQAKWEKIAEADRVAIDKVSGEVIARNFSRIWDESEARAIAAMTAAGLKTHRPAGKEDETLRAQLASIKEGWIKEARQRNVDVDGALAFYAEQLNALKTAAK